MLGEMFSIQLAVVPDHGEDSFAMSSMPGNALLCVADGCGGLGSKRYDKLEHHTGAYLASRLVARAVMGWWQEHPQVPLKLEEGRYLLDDLQQEVQAVFSNFASVHCQDETSRIVGSMQRTLPTTLCSLFANERSKAGCFIWAGDSRGYTLDGKGLHQFTEDDVRGNPDAFEGVLLDRPLSNLICADRQPQLHMRRFSMPEKGLLLCMTDGAYNVSSSPMELEMLLLDTMMHSASQSRWQRKLEKTLAASMQDDMTVLCCVRGFVDYDAMKQYFQPRYEQLKREFITPARRKRKNREVARAYWQHYRLEYDRTEGTANGQQDWRI